MKNSRSRLTGLAGAASALALTLAACGGGAAEDQGDGGAAAGDGGGEPQEVTVGIVQLPIFAPIYVAEAKGYFEDEGLDVNLENVKSGQDAIPLAASGQIDVVAAGFAAGFFSAIDTGLEVTVVGSMGVTGPEGEDPASALVVSKELHDSGEITELADLKDRKIGVLGGGGATGAFFTSLALEEAGLGTDDVEFVNLANADMPAGLQTGGIDAAFLSAPFWNNTVDDEVAVKLWQAEEGISGTGVIYGEHFADSDLAQPFFNAMARGAQDLQGEDRYSDENLEIIGAATDQTAEQVSSVPLYHWHTDLHPLPEQLQGMEQVWLDYGALEYGDPLDPATYVDGSFADAVE